MEILNENILVDTFDHNALRFNHFERNLQGYWKKKKKKTSNTHTNKKLELWFHTKRFDNTTLKQHFTVL